MASMILFTDHSESPLPKGLFPSKRTTRTGVATRRFVFRISPVPGPEHQLDAPASGALNEISADGSGTPELLLKGASYLGHMDWSPDGHMVFTDFSADLPSLKIYSARGQRVDSFAIGAEARFSPDRKWIAYLGPLTVPDSDAIFIAPFPGPGGRIRLSSGSGAQPNWAADVGHRLDRRSEQPTKMTLRP